MVKLGEKARDKVSGFTGIAVARTEWMYGCVRITIQPHVGSDGKKVDADTFDEPAVEAVTDEPEKISLIPKAMGGGPIPTPKQAPGPVR